MSYHIISFPEHFSNQVLKKAIYKGSATDATHTKRTMIEPNLLSFFQFQAMKLIVLMNIKASMMIVIMLIILLIRLRPEYNDGVSTVMMEELSFFPPPPPPPPLLLPPPPPPIASGAAS